MKAFVTGSLLLFLLCSTCFGQDTAAQASNKDVPIEKQKFIWFPHPLNAPSRWSAGLTLTTMPIEITEELRNRIPAADLHLAKKMGGKVDLHARLLFQLVQNMMTVGPRWSTPLNDRISIALGNDLAFWFGRINVESIKTRSYGFQNFPYIAVGARLNRGILLSLRAEQILTFGVKTKAGNTEVKSDYRLMSGSSYTIAVEQPFSGKSSMTLGFRAIYTDYYWQTWTLFENYNRNLFLPQFIIGLIL